MKKKLMKKASAAVMAFVLIGGAAVFPVGDKSLFDSALTVNAADYCCSFNNLTGVLTLHGNVVKEDVLIWNNVLK